MIRKIDSLYSWIRWLDLREILLDKHPPGHPLEHILWFLLIQWLLIHIQYIFDHIMGSLIHPIALVLMVQQDLPIWMLMAGTVFVLLIMEPLLTFVMHWLVSLDVFVLSMLIQLV